MAVSGSTARGCRIHSIIDSGVLGSTPARYRRLAIPFSGGPTIASAPVTPGITWQVWQAYCRTATRPRWTSPPVTYSDCSSREPHATSEPSATPRSSARIIA